MYKVKWSLLVMVTTIVITLVFLYIDISLILGLFHSANVTLYVFILVIVNIIFLYIICNIPLYIKVTDESVIVKKVKGKIQIKYSDIAFVKEFNPAADLRIFGSGGFFGFIGKFSNNDYGWYSSYVLNSKQTFLLSLKNNEKYAFSCENSNEIINKINMRIV